MSKLTDTKSNRPRVTLLHFIVEEIHSQDDTILAFVEKLEPVLQSVSRYFYDIEMEVF